MDAVNESLSRSAQLNQCQPHAASTTYSLITMFMHGQYKYTVCLIKPYLNPCNSNTYCQCQRFPAHKWLLGGKSRHGVGRIFDSLTAFITFIFYGKWKVGNVLAQAYIPMHCSKGIHQIHLLGSCLIKWIFMQTDRWVDTQPKYLIEIL